MKTMLLILSSSLITLPAFAADQNITVDFMESAPKDRFTITNSGGCPLSATVTIDLTKSAGKLIFDTTSSGAGVEVFQPFEVVAGSPHLLNDPKISDGDKSVSLDIQNLPSREKIAFTIDVDDTLIKSELGQIRVSGSEITGAQVQVEHTSIVTTDFGANGQASIAMGACVTS